MMKFFAFLIYLTVLFGPAVIAQESVILPPEIGIKAQNVPPRPVPEKLPANAQIVSEFQPRVVIQKNKPSSFALPYLKSIPEPILYPKLAVHRGWEGEATVAVEVLTNGAVGRRYIVKSSDHELLDQTALQSAENWEFQPAIKNGQPVVSHLEIPITFRLKD